MRPLSNDHLSESAPDGQRTPPNKPDVVSTPDAERHVSLPPSLVKILRDQGIDPRDPEVSKVLEITFTSISGSSSLPPAVLLEQWERLYPGITAKFVEWTEAQSSHRRALETERSQRSEARQDKSQIIFGITAVTGLFLSAAVGVWGHWFVATVIAIVSVGGPTAATALANRGHNPASRGRPPEPQRIDRG